MAEAERSARHDELESGEITFFYRPRVEEQSPEHLDDVQRVLMLLSPSDAPMERLVAIGRKPLPSGKRGERFWGFVDLVLAPYDMQAALGAQIYGTKTRGLRHLPAAQPIAHGTYELTWHEEHAHLRWNVQPIATDDPLAEGLDIEQEDDFILTVANPDAAAWGLEEMPDLQGQLFDTLEVHVPLPTPFPERLQQRFRGRKYVQIDSVEWLDHPGAELVFIGAR